VCQFKNHIELFLTSLESREKPNVKFEFKKSRQNPLIAISIESFFPTAFLEN